MPNRGPLPSWLKPANPLAYFLPAMQASSQLALAKQKMQQQAQLDDRQMALRERSLQEESARRSQELEIERQYKAIQLQLAERKMEQQAAQSAEEAQQAWQKWNETRQDRELQRRFIAESQDRRLQQQQAFSATQQDQRLAAAMDRMKERAAITHREMPEQVVGKSAVDEQGNPIPGVRYYPTPTGWTVRSDPGFASGLVGERSTKALNIRNRMSLLKAERADVIKQFTPGSRPANPERAKGYDAAMQRLGAIDEEMNKLAPPIGEEGQAPGERFMPAPKDPAEREADTTYMTPKGPHTWTGKGWVPYEPGPPVDEGTETPADEEEEPLPVDEEDEEDLAVAP
jgi:hypothetical protein